MRKGSWTTCNTLFGFVCHDYTYIDRWKLVSSSAGHARGKRQEEKQQQHSVVVFSSSSFSGQWSRRRCQQQPRRRTWVLIRANYSREQSFIWPTQVWWQPKGHTRRNYFSPTTTTKSGGRRRFLLRHLTFLIKFSDQVRPGSRRPSLSHSVPK